MTISRFCSFRYFLRAILVGLFIYSVIMALKQLLAQETGTSVDYKSASCPMPFLSICPHRFAEGKYPYFIKGQNKTLTDFFKAAPTMQSFITSNLYETFYFGKNKSLEPLLDKVTITDFVTTNYIETRLVRCALLNTSGFPSISDQVTVGIGFNLSVMKTIGIEKHHYSLPTQATFKSNGEQITYVQDTDFKREILKINRRIHLDLPRRECDEDNNQHEGNCINNFVIKHLACQLPWLPSNSQTQLRDCNLPKDLDYFIDLSNKIMSGEKEKELEEFGCRKPNCITDEWYMVSRDTFVNYENKNQFGAVVLEMSPNHCWKITKDVLIYGFGNFIADFGGYLGLLLGASILSIYDSGKELLQMASLKLKRKQSIAIC